ADLAFTPGWIDVFHERPLDLVTASEPLLALDIALDPVLGDVLERARGDPGQSLARIGFESRSFLAGGGQIEVGKAPELDELRLAGPVVADLPCLGAGVGDVEHQPGAAAATVVPVFDLLTGGRSQVLDDLLGQVLVGHRRSIEHELSN